MQGPLNGVWILQRHHHPGHGFSDVPMTRWQWLNDPRLLLHLLLLLTQRFRALLLACCQRLNGGLAETKQKTGWRGCWRLWSPCIYPWPATPALPSSLLGNLLQHFELINLTPSLDGYLAEFIRFGNFAILNISSKLFSQFPVHTSRISGRYNI